jgi:short subunit fatty acids transporter
MGALDRFQEIIEKKLPDPLTFALALTAFMAVLALTLTATPPTALLMKWGDSLSILLTFTMQIGLTIILAYVLSQTPLMQKGLKHIARLATTPTQAYILVIVTAATFYLISWPLGPITGALVAREIAREAVTRNNPVHFPLMAVGALSGYAVWEMGYSSSIALAVATEGNPTYEIIGRVIPIQETLLTHWNLLSIVSTLAVIIATVLILHKQFNLKKPYIPTDLVTPLETSYESAADAQPPQGRRRWSIITGPISRRLCHWMVCATGIVIGAQYSQLDFSRCGITAGKIAAALQRFICRWRAGRSAHTAAISFVRGHHGHGDPKWLGTAVYSRARCHSHANNPASDRFSLSGTHQYFYSIGRSAVGSAGSCLYRSCKIVRR